MFDKIRTTITRALKAVEPVNLAIDEQHDDGWDSLYLDDPGCILDKNYFVHVRRYTWDDFDCDTYLSNHGGATLCFRVEKGAQEGTYWLVYTWAQCNLKEKDQFSRKIGREVCLDNFKHHPKHVFWECRTGLPTVNKTRDYIIDQFRIFKSKYYSKVWQEYF